MENNTKEIKDCVKANLTTNLKEAIKNKLDQMFISDNIISYKWYPEFTFKISPDICKGFYTSVIQATISNFNMYGIDKCFYTIDKFIIPIRIFVDADFIDSSCININIIADNIIENALLIGECNDTLFYIDASKFKERFLDVRSIDWKDGYLNQNRLWVGTHTGHYLDWNIISSIKSHKDEFYISILTDECIQYDYLLKLHNRDCNIKSQSISDSFLSLYKLNETIIANYEHNIIPNVVYVAYNSEGFFDESFNITLEEPLGVCNSVDIYSKFVEDVKNHFKPKGYTVKETESKLALDVCHDEELICSVRLGPNHSKK